MLTKSVVVIAPELLNLARRVASECKAGRYAVFCAHELQCWSRCGVPRGVKGRQYAISSSQLDVLSAPGADMLARNRHPGCNINSRRPFSCMHHRPERRTIYDVGRMRWVEWDAVRRDCDNFIADEHSRHQLDRQQRHQTTYCGWIVGTSPHVAC